MTTLNKTYNPRDLESWMDDAEDPGQFEEAMHKMFEEHDPVTFQELFMQVPSPTGMVPYKAYEYQKAISRDPSTQILINKARQIGMSVSTVLDHLHRGIFNPSYHCSFISAKKETADELISKLRDIIYAMPDEWQIPIVHDAGGYIQIGNGKEGRGGAQYRAFAAKENAVRSFTGDLVCDEASSIPSFDLVLRGALATTVRTGYRVRILSTPRGNLNLFGEMVTAARALRKGTATKVQEMLVKDWSYYEIPWTECGHTINGQWVPDLQESRIRALCINEEMFRQEFRCEIVDESTAMLSYELLTRNTANDLPQFSMYNNVEQHNGSTYFIGIDPASQVNEAGFVISEKTKDNHWNIRFVNAQPMVNSVLTEYTVNWYKHVQPLRIYVDKNNIGLPFCQDVAKQIGSWAVIDVPISDKSKEWLVYNMVGLFESGKLTIPNNDKLFQQLHALEQDNSILKGVKTFTGKIKSDQDDLIWATALSLAHNYLNPPNPAPRLIQPFMSFGKRHGTYKRGGYGRDDL